MKHKILQIVVVVVFVAASVLFAIYLDGIKTKIKSPSDIIGNSTQQVSNREDRTFQTSTGEQYVLRGSTILGSEMMVADPVSLEYIQGAYFKDKINVYAIYGVPGHVLRGVNPETFKVISNSYYFNFNSWHYTLENNRVMYVSAGFLSDFTQTVLHANPDRFRVLADAYMTDDTSIFFQDRNILADKDSFQVLSLGSNKEYSHYAKDKKHVFYAGNRLYKADPKTFEVMTLDKFIIGKDATQVFIDGKLLDGISAKDVKLEIGKKMGYIISDEDTNWYYYGHCDGAGFVSEQDFFDDQYENWDKVKYLEEYVFC